MKKLLTILLIVFSLSAFTQTSPKFHFVVDDATTAFGINLPKGCLIYDLGQTELYILTAPAVSTATLTTATAQRFPSVVGTPTNNYAVLWDDDHNQSASTLIYDDGTSVGIGLAPADHSYILELSGILGIQHTTSQGIYQLGSSSGVKHWFSNGTQEWSLGMDNRGEFEIKDEIGTAVPFKIEKGSNDGAFTITSSGVTVSDNFYSLLITDDGTDVSIDGAEVFLPNIDNADQDYFQMYDLSTGEETYFAKSSLIGGFIDYTGTPNANEVALFVDQNTVQGNSSLTYGSYTLNVGQAATGVSSTIDLHGAGSGILTLSPNSTGTDYTFTFPDDNGSDGQFLQRVNGGVTGWTTLDTLINGYGIETLAYDASAGATVEVDTSEVVTPNALMDSINNNAATTYWEDAGSNHIQNTNSGNVLIDNNIVVDGASNYLGATAATSETYFGNPAWNTKIYTVSGAMTIQSGGNLVLYSNANKLNWNNTGLYTETAGIPLGRGGDPFSGLYTYLITDDGTDVTITGDEVFLTNIDNADQDYFQMYDLSTGEETYFAKSSILGDYILWSDTTSTIATKWWVGEQGYLTSYTETDPIWVADSANYLSKGDTTNGQVATETWVEDQGYSTVTESEDLSDFTYTGRAAGDVLYATSSNLWVNIPFSTLMANYQVDNDTTDWDATLSDLADTAAAIRADFPVGGSSDSSWTSVTVDSLLSNTDLLIKPTGGDVTIDGTLTTDDAVDLDGITEDVTPDRNLVQNSDGQVKYSNVSWGSWVEFNSTETFSANTMAYVDIDLNDGTWYYENGNGTITDNADGSFTVTEDGTYYIEFDVTIESSVGIGSTSAIYFDNIPHRGVWDEMDDGIGTHISTIETLESGDSFNLQIVGGTGTKGVEKVSVKVYKIH